MDTHITAVNDACESQPVLRAESVIYLNANLDAVYYDLLQLHLRTGGLVSAIPPPHQYFPSLIKLHPGTNFKPLVTPLFPSHSA